MIRNYSNSSSHYDARYQHMMLDNMFAYGDNAPGSRCFPPKCLTHTLPSLYSRLYKIHLRKQLVAPRHIMHCVAEPIEISCQQFSNRESLHAVDAATNCDVRSNKIPVAML
ncbi:hypothetical protein TNCV_4613481 [Trichonephila clavipes]|nr:hypothetical protein TNCV_4613481 [Trichonephila clavipes]